MYIWTYTSTHMLYTYLTLYVCDMTSSRPGALYVARAVLLAGSTVGAELSLVYEWSGFWSLPWHMDHGVFRMLCIIGRIP